MSEVVLSETSLKQADIQVEGLSKSYTDGTRKLQVLSELHFSVPSGEQMAILGPSGSGKSTLLNLLAGLDRPDKGEVRIGGASLHRLGETERARFRNRAIGFVFQFYHLLPEFTALENVVLPALIAGHLRSEKAIRIKAGRLLESIGLTDRAGHYPSELSGGEQQRVAIARALINDPPVLLCDEPTGNLDAERGLEIAALLRSLATHQKKTVLIVTHDERIAKMADKVLTLGTNAWSTEQEGGK